MVSRNVIFCYLYHYSVEYVLKLSSIPDNTVPAGARSFKPQLKKKTKTH
jgi:hypothetical protein